MRTRLLFLTGDPRIGRFAEAAGVDWVFVDLETRGKAERQAGRDTVLSAHTLGHVRAMRAVLSRARLLVRVNPIGEWSRREIDGAIAEGADIVMLPFFTTPEEVRRFVGLVDGRARTCLLVETMGAVNRIESILAVPGIDFVHIGLNDLHIERRTRFMFEPFADGLLDDLTARIRPSGIPFGIGGMARIGEKLPPAEAILAEHYRLGSTGVILSRSFAAGQECDDPAALAQRFADGVDDIRMCEAHLGQADASFFEANRRQTREQIRVVAEGAAQARP